MSSFISKLIANVGYIVTAVYSLINLIAVILYNTADFEKAIWFIDTVLAVDIFTWFFYGALSIISFALLIFTGKEDREKSKGIFIFKVASHLIMMIISFICIMTMFEYSF